MSIHKKKPLVQTILTFRKNHTLQETSDTFGITSERVRQVALEVNRLRCSKHNRYYFNSCSHCAADTYATLVKQYTYKQLLVDVEKEKKNRKRDYLSVQRKKALINVLYNEYGYSFLKIADMLGRHYSSIANLAKQL